MLVLVLAACTPELSEPGSRLEEAASFVLRDESVRLRQAVFGLGDLVGGGAEALGVGWSEGVDLSVEPHLSVWFRVPSGEATLADADLEIVNDSGNGWFVDSGECSNPRVPGKRNVLPLGDLDLPALAGRPTEAREPAAPGRTAPGAPQPVG